MAKQTRVRPGRRPAPASRPAKRPGRPVGRRPAPARNWPMLVAVAVIVVLVVAIGVSIVRAVGSGDDPGGGSAPSASGPTPAGAADGALRIGSATAPVRVQVYLDYMCPYCGRFERANGTELQNLVSDGTVRLELYPLAFLDRMSDGTRYSTRAANAVATVADRAPDQVLAFSTALFVDQPAEGSPGRTDAQIAAVARDAGVPGPVVDTFAERRFEPWISASTEAAFRADITGTPTVKINGKRYEGDLYTAGPLTGAVRAAKGNP